MASRDLELCGVTKAEYESVVRDGIYQALNKDGKKNVYAALSMAIGFAIESQDALDAYLELFKDQSLRGIIKERIKKWIAFDGTEPGAADVLFQVDKIQELISVYPDLIESIDLMIDFNKDKAGFYISGLERINGLGFFESNEDAKMLFKILDSDTASNQFGVFVFLAYGLDIGLINKPLSKNLRLPDFLSRFRPDVGIYNRYASILDDESLDDEEKQSRIKSLQEEYKIPSLDEYFEVLDIPPGSSPEEIKFAYKKLSFTHHPDRGGSGEEFKRVYEAYQAIKNYSGPVAKKKKEPIKSLGE